MSNEVCTIGSWSWWWLQLTIAIWRNEFFFFFFPWHRSLVHLPFASPADLLFFPMIFYLFSHPCWLNVITNYFPFSSLCLVPPNSLVKSWSTSISTSNSVIITLWLYIPAAASLLLSKNASTPVVPNNDDLIKWSMIPWPILICGRFRRCCGLGHLTGYPPHHRISSHFWVSGYATSSLWCVRVPSSTVIRFVLRSLYLQHICVPRAFGIFEPQIFRYLQRLKFSFYFDISASCLGCLTVLLR